MTKIAKRAVKTLLMQTTPMRLNGQSVRVRRGKLQPLSPAEIRRREFEALCKADLSTFCPSTRA
jgi:hypothetical protein